VRIWCDSTDRDRKVNESSNPFHFDLSAAATPENNLDRVCHIELDSVLIQWEPGDGDVVSQNPYLLLHVSELESPHAVGSNMHLGRSFAVLVGGSAAGQDNRSTLHYSRINGTVAGGELQFDVPTAITRLTFRLLTAGGKEISLETTENKANKRVNEFSAEPRVFYCMLLRTAEKIEANVLLHHAVQRDDGPLFI
jgi:hypothetical protein